MNRLSRRLAQLESQHTPNQENSFAVVVKQTHESVQQAYDRQGVHPSEQHILVRLVAAPNYEESKETA